MPHSPCHISSKFVKFASPPPEKNQSSRPGNVIYVSAIFSGQFMVFEFFTRFSSLMFLQSLAKDLNIILWSFRNLIKYRLDWSGLAKHGLE